MVWIWQHVKMTDDSGIILNFEKEKYQKEVGKGPNFFKSLEHKMFFFGFSGSQSLIETKRV
jgi:hypothetical protein